MQRFVRLCGFIVLVALPLVASLAGCPGPDWPKCENDDHCKENGDQTLNYVCVFGQCQECGRDTDCKDGKKCKANRCMASCKADNECGSGMSCDAKSGDCIKKVVEKPKTPPPAPKGGAGASCVEDGDCSSGFVCQTNVCTDASTVGSGGGAGECPSETAVLFEFNVFDLTPEARSTLDQTAQCLKANTSSKLAIEGHADERGTTQYNLDLGDKRARAVKDYIVRLGIDGGRITTVSYGEERPAVNGSDEGAWAKNRRGVLKLK